MCKSRGEGDRREGGVRGRMFSANTVRRQAMSSHVAFEESLAKRNKKIKK